MDLTNDLVKELERKDLQLGQCAAKVDTNNEISREAQQKEAEYKKGLEEKK